MRLLQKTSHETPWLTHSNWPIKTFFTSIEKKTFLWITHMFQIFKISK